MTGTTVTRKVPLSTTVAQNHDFVVKKFGDVEKMIQRRDSYNATLRRKSTQGTTRANAQVEALKKRFERLEGSLGVNADPAKQQFVKTELETIDARLTTLFGEVQTEVAELRQTVDEHTEELRVLAEQGTDHGGRIGVLETEQSMTSEGVLSLNGRVSTIESGTKFPFIRFAVAAVIGLIAGLIWNAVDFGYNQKLPDGTDFWIDLPLANSPWVAIAFGLALFAIAFGLMTLLGRQDNIEVVHGERSSFWTRTKRSFSQRRTQQNAGSIPPVPPAPEPVTTGVSDAPTEVIPTSTGASSAR